MDSQNQPQNPQVPPLAPQPPVSPVPTNPHSRRRLIVYGFIAIISIIAIAAGAYTFGMQKSPKNVTPATPTPAEEASEKDPTTDWKTYESKYGYSLKYPANWAVEDSSGDNGARIWSNSKYMEDFNKNPQAFNKEDYATIDVSYYLNGSQTAFGSVSASTNLDTFVKDRYEKILIGTKPTTLAGLPAVIVRIQRYVLPDSLPIGTQNCPSQSDCMVVNGSTEAVWAKINGDILNISYNYGREYEDVANLEKTFTAFLSSFALDK